MSVEREIAERIAGWRPEGLRVGDVPDWVLFVRATVAAAGPREHPEARDGLRWCADLVQAAVAAGRPLVAETLFAPASVDSYMATVTAPTGTKARMASTLKRQHPMVGFAGTTRTPAAAKAVEANVVEPSVRLVERVRPPMSPDVAAAIERFVPTLLPDSLWLQIRSVVLTVVRDAAPGSPERAVIWCRDVAYLTGWLHTQHRVVAPGLIVKASTIEEFLTVLLAHGRAERSVASYASTLHAVRDACGLPLDVVRRKFKKPTAKDPYNTAEVDHLYEQARRIPSKGRRLFVTASLDLMFGCGAMPGELAAAAPDDVSEVASGAVVVLAGRPVPVLPGYVSGIVRAAASARDAGEQFLIGGLPTNRLNRLNGLLRGKNERWVVDADSRRARATWLVEIAARPTQSGGLPGLLAMAGLSTMHRFNELLDDIAARQLELSDSSFLAVASPVTDRPSEVAS